MQECGEATVSQAPFYSEFYFSNAFSKYFNNAKLKFVSLMSEFLPSFLFEFLLSAFSLALPPSSPFFNVLIFFIDTRQEKDILSENRHNIFLICGYSDFLFVIIIFLIVYVLQLRRGSTSDGLRFFSIEFQSMQFLIRYSKDPSLKRYRSGKSMS